MENKKKLSTGAVIGIVVLALLSVGELIINIVFSVKYYPVPALLFELVPYAFLFIAISYYALVGYKKPHGDLLRLVFLVFSISCLCTLVSQVIDVETQGDAAFVILIGLAALLTAYMGGRLDKIRKNYAMLVIVGLTLLVKAVLNYIAYSGADFLFLAWGLSTFVLWLDIVFVYVLRYREHKEAGLADK